MLLNLSKAVKPILGSLREFRAIALSMWLQPPRSFLLNLILIAWIRETHFMFILNCDGASNSDHAGGDCIISSNKGMHVANCLITIV